MMKVLTIILLVLPLAVLSQDNGSSKGYYQITIYNFATAGQQKTISDYLQKAYIPALHNQKIQNVGVFTPIANDTAANKQLYIIIPLVSFEQAATLTGKISTDQQYLSNAKTYLDAGGANPPYKRMENILLEKFSMAAFFTLPKLKNSNAEKIYELRSYESPTEKIFNNKVEMFNEGGEIKLFEQLNFNAVFYAKVIAGCHMPNLMYMTSFENLVDRDEHWKKFGASEEWKKLSAMPYYKDNVSKIDVTLMKATDYSDY